MNLKNKVIITGASSGIGLEFGNQLETLGWKIVNISRSPSRFKNVKMDLSVISCIDNFMQVIKKEKPNMIIFNSGILYNKWLGEYSNKEIITMNNLNFVIPTLLLNKLINTRIKLVFISSVISRMTPSVQSIYGASKSYLSKVVQAAQSEQLYLSKKTNIVEIIPGKFTATNLNSQLISRENSQREFLKNEIKIVSKKILQGDITIWTHGNFYKSIAKKFFEKPLEEGQKSIKYRIKSKVIYSK